MYRSAFRAFWKESRFTIDGSTITCEAISRLREEDLQNIGPSRLTASHTAPLGNLHEFELLSVNGAWEYIISDESGSFDQHFHAIDRPNVIFGPVYKTQAATGSLLTYVEGNRWKASMKQQLEFIAWRCEREFADRCFEEW